MRECGLKQIIRPKRNNAISVTPHAGVWIETTESFCSVLLSLVTPHAGVWIETIQFQRHWHQKYVTPHAGVWIET